MICDKCGFSIHSRDDGFVITKVSHACPNDLVDVDLPPDND